MRRLAAVLFTGSVLVAGCSSSQGDQDPLQVAATLHAATPANSPQQNTTPPGTVLPLDGRATAVTVDPASRTLAVAVAAPPSVRLYSLTNLSAPARTVPLPGEVDHLDLASGQVVASVASAGQVLRIALPAGTVTADKRDGGPADTATVGARTLVALRDSKAVTVLDGAATQRTIGGITSPDQVLAVGDRAVVLDRLRSAVFDLDPDNSAVGAGLRAGNGATNAVVDRFNRVLVTATDGNELLAFSANPLIMRQRFPLPGSPYGIAYDGKRDLAWVTLTARNEVVGFDVAGGEPVEKHRFATVAQPNSVAVDPDSGQVFVVSANGQGIQVISQ
ncbi:hypothetical protein F0L68_31885 [Solihabitans fulvus]|uniref:DNA-binding beta-propeller fold protein YncE n=1 Tax=Solihabitans fulvus TaxID=1892852 RepID=A0A5B2WVF0_9PSEU|nr:hypothetical protein [Solihabitans fulvus]KAA2253877.1 hypothetical protein F0L68_31885 [Solihabitans fulvus]